MLQASRDTHEDVIVLCLVKLSLSLLPEWVPPSAPQDTVCNASVSSIAEVLLDAISSSIDVHIC